MRSVRERLGWTLATLSFAIYFLLSLAHMIGMGGHVMSAPTRSTSSVAIAASSFSEAGLLSALAEICTGDGIAQHTADGKGGKPPLFPTCPICSLYVAVTLVLLSVALLLVSLRFEIAWVRPLVVTKRLSGHLLNQARPRAPPSL